MVASNTIFVSHEGPANALALNKDSTQVVIAGRNVFKVFSIENDEFREVCNLRVGKNLNLNYSSIDVAWSPIEENTLATAATNGAVVVWNLGRSGRSKQEHVFCDHKRTVNKVSFHLTEPSLLISGSQDGMMKCFDLRMKEVARTFISNTESVRDVQFSRQRFHEFAAVSENGSVQVWDVRRADRPLHHYTAHSGPVFACDWHPDMPWLATASRDKTIKVWDIHNKPTLEHTIYTIASVGHVKWRPQKKYQVASCALVLDSWICIWDVRRPHVPFATFDEHRDVTTAVAWTNDPEVLYSTSRDCTLYRHTFARARYPALSANPQGTAISARGELTLAAAKNTHPSVAGPQWESTFAAGAAAGVVCWRAPTTNAMVDCAKEYRLRGGTPAQLCEYNAGVARKYGRNIVSQVWEVAGALHAVETGGAATGAVGRGVSGTQPPPVDPDSSGATDTRPDNYSYTQEEENENEEWSECQFQYSGVLGLPTQIIYIPHNGNRDEGLWASAATAHYVDVDGADWSLPQEAFPHAPRLHSQSSVSRNGPMTASPGGSSNGSVTSNQNPPIPPLNFSHQTSITTVEDQPVCELRVRAPGSNPCALSGGSDGALAAIAQGLRAHAALGDVQTCVAVLLALGDSRTDLLSYIEEPLQEHWLLGYIELLAKHKLWNLATEVIRSAWLPSVWQLSVQSTVFHVSCGRCGRHLQRAACDKCRVRPAVCAVCKQVVRGLFAWCQGCAHGGHLFHMQEWLKNNKQCPTGCGHNCEYT